MNEQNQLGKRARSALSDEQFAQASMALIQRWRLTLSIGNAPVAGPVLAIAPAMGQLSTAGNALCANNGPAPLGLRTAA